MQDQYLINVDRDAINNAQVNNEFHCPIAYAIARDFDLADGTEVRFVRVNRRRIGFNVDGQRYWIDTPAPISRWLDRLDEQGRKAAKSFKFTLSLAAMNLMRKPKANPDRIAQPSRHRETIQRGRSTIRRLGGAA